MHSAQGKWYDGKTSQSHDITISFAGGILTVTGDGIASTISLSQIRIEPRLGKAMRTLRFPGGEVLETSDQEFVETLEKMQGRGGFFRGVHRWESHLGRVFVAFGVLAAIAFCFVRFGIPALATRAAFAFPASTERLLGHEALKLLDQIILKPSKLPVKRRRELTSVFAAMTANNPEREKWRLEFRSGEVIGANAFALPSGIVIVTDRLVEIAKSDNEIAAVMAHEVGHLEKRHALRHLLQNSATALLVATVTGDITSVSSLSATLPTTLIDAKYSRDFEVEADDAAVAYLKREKIPVQVYADILTRLQKDHDKDGKDDGKFGDLFMDHPLMQERVGRVLRKDGVR